MEAGQKSGGGELVCNSTDSRLDWPTVRFSLSFIYTPLALASSSGSITSTLHTHTLTHTHTHTQE